MQFNEAVYEYLNDKQNGRKPLRPNTLEGYMSAIKCHLMPKWSGREMESVTADELQAWVDSFERRHAQRKVRAVKRPTAIHPAPIRYEL